MRMQSSKKRNKFCILRVCNDYYTVIGISITRNRINCKSNSNITLHFISTCREYFTCGESFFYLHSNTILYFIFIFIKIIFLLLFFFSLLISLFSLLISIFFFPVLSQDPRQTHGSTTTPRPKPKPPSTQTPLENPNPENLSHQKIGEQGELRRREGRKRWGERKFSRKWEKRKEKKLYIPVKIN